MTAQQIGTLARAARKAGITSILQLQIAGELLSRGEATLISISNSLNVSLEAVSFAAAQMEMHQGLRIISCRTAVGFCIVSLTPAAEETLRSFLQTPISTPKTFWFDGVTPPTEEKSSTPQ